MYSYEEVLEESVIYFGGDELAGKVFTDKYALRDNEGHLLEISPKDEHKRIAKEFARIEKDKFEKPLTEKEIFNLLDHYKYICVQGSPAFGIGNDYQTISLSNCYVVDSPVDSYGGILKADQELIQISKRRGGVGIDLSKLRPKGAPTKNAARNSTGLVSWMERYSNSIREVGQDGRRGALMLTCDIDHPDILDFISIKNDPTKVTGANISVKISDKFMETAENNPIWHKIVESAWNRAEPGVLFWDRITSYNAIDCYKDFKTISTNPSLRSNTLVLTKDGIFDIESLSKKEKIEVLNCFGEWKEATAFKSGKDKKLIKITFTNNSEVYCTPEHKWPILNSTNQLVNKYGKIIKKQTSELIQQDKIYFPTFDKPINNSNCNLSNEDGFICGWTLGDGWKCFHKNQNTTQYGFEFSQEDIQSGIGNRILDYTNNIAKNPSSLRRDHKCNAYTFCTTDKLVTSKLDNIGCDYKELGLPKTIWTSNHNFIRGFIDGYFSSDGHIYIDDKLTRCHITVTSCHNKILNELRKFLNFYGIKSYITHQTTKNVKFPNGKNYNKTYHRYDLKISGLHAFKFGKIFKLSNLKKQSKIDKILNMDKSDYTNNRQYLCIKSIEETNLVEDVYDITVMDDTHTFLMETGITGNCGELPLCAYDSCRLMFLNMYSYVQSPFEVTAWFDFDLFEEHVEIAQRLMDDLIDLELEKIEKIIEKIDSDPEPQYIKEVEKSLWLEIYSKCSTGRRTGLGTTGDADAMAALGIKYGSEESIKFVDQVHREMKLASYSSSMEMAKELGPFPAWKWETEKDSPFLLQIKAESPQLYEDISKYGRRNIGNLTKAPVGTRSICTQTSSGIEPVYKLNYTRRKKINHNDETKPDFIDPSGDKWLEFEVLHPKLKIWSEITGETDIKKSPYWGCTAEEINWTNRVKMQAAAQKHIDHSISSTVNLSENVTKEEVANIYMTAWKSGCKGMTIYRNNCRTGVLIDKKTEQKPVGRPKKLKAHIYYPSVKGTKYFVCIGINGGGLPYEIFAGILPEPEKQPEEGFIQRVKAGSYSLISDNEIIIPSLCDYCDDSEEALARMASIALRSHVDLHLIIDQLEKTKGPINIFAKAMLRILRKYLPENIKVGEKCPECGDNIVYSEGCKKCSKCGWSKC